MRTLCYKFAQSFIWSALSPCLYLQVVKAFTSPPKRPAVTSSGEVANSSQPVAVTSRGPDIANSPAVPPELSNLPPTFSIFPVVQGGEQGQASQGGALTGAGWVGGGCVDQGV